ncbi:L-asparaginase II [Bordetella trematum]|nr:L-asparaginase II [Bordetella trematum]
MPERPLPRIVLLATGGTIAGAQEQAASLSYRAASLGAQELLQAVPQLQALAQVDAEQLVSVGSQNMTYEVWHTLADRISDLQADPAVDGVVITHGTDTLEETAYFLSLVLPFGKPVVLVGAMRPATALSADGPRNLYNAVALAAHPDSHGRGPLVTLNDEIHYARDVQKMASIGVAAFASPNAGRAGRVRGAEVVFHGERDIPSAAAARTFPWPCRRPAIGRASKSSIAAWIRMPGWLTSWQVMHRASCWLAWAMAILPTPPCRRWQAPQRGAWRWCAARAAVAARSARMSKSMMPPMALSQQANSIHRKRVSC